MLFLSCKLCFNISPIALDIMYMGYIYDISRIALDLYMYMGYLSHIALDLYMYMGYISRIVLDLNV